MKNPPCVISSQPFPHYISITKLNESSYSMSCNNQFILDFSVAPAITFEIYKIHPLRLVPSLLAHELISRNDSNLPLFG